MKKTLTRKRWRLILVALLFPCWLVGCNSLRRNCDEGYVNGPCLEGFCAHGECSQGYCSQGCCLEGCCAHDCFGIDRCATIPRGAIPVPAGTYLHQWQRSQAEIAEADDFVFYRNEWLNDGVRLGPAGSRHFTEIVPRVGLSPHPVVIESSDDDPDKDARRRWEMISMLSAEGIPSPEQFVVVGRPSYVQGMLGEEAEIVHDELLSDRSYGGAASFLGGAGGFGGFGGLGGLGGFGFGGFGGIGFRR